MRTAPRGHRGQKQGRTAAGSKTSARKAAARTASNWGLGLGTVRRLCAHGSARTALHTRLCLRGWLAAWGLAGQRAGDPGGRGRAAGVQRLRGWGLPPWGLAPLCPVSPTDWMSPHAAEDAPLRPVCRLKREPQAQSGRPGRPRRVWGADAIAQLHAPVRQDASRVPEPPCEDRRTCATPPLGNGESPREDHRQPTGDGRRGKAAEEKGEPAGGRGGGRAGSALSEAPRGGAGPGKAPTASPNSRKDRGPGPPSARRRPRRVATWRLSFPCIHFPTAWPPEARGPGAPCETL